MRTSLFGRIRWLPVALGAAAALLLGLLGPGEVWVTLLGVSGGALVASVLAREAGLLHGGAVAAFWILLIALVAPDRLPADTVALLAYDAAHLAGGALAGWAPRRD